MNESQFPSTKTRLWTIFWVFITSVTLDQGTKILAQSHLKYAPTKKYLWDTFRFQYAENAGAFLGLGSNLPDIWRFWILTGVSGLLLFVLFIFLVRTKSDLYTTVSLALILGGGVSNLLDRGFRDSGKVVDFMNMGIGSLRTGIFNIADMGIMAGVFMILFQPMFFKASREKEPEPLGQTKE
jgi:signal peptidase II